MTAFHHQYSVRVEMCGCLHQNNPHGIQTVTATGERQRGFLAIFMR